MNAIAGSLSAYCLDHPTPPIPSLPVEPAIETTIVETAPAKPRVWSVFAVWFGAFVVGNLALVMVLGIAIGVTAIAVANPGDDFAVDILPKVQAALSNPALALMLTLVPYQLVMLAVLALAVRWSKEPALERTGLLKPSGRKVGPLRLILLAGFTASAAYAVALLFAAIFGPAPASAAAGAENWAWWTIPVYGLILTVLPAVIEEIFFRGYLQRRLLQRWSPTVAIAVSTSLFAIVHMDSLQHIVAVIPLGIVTGLVAYRTNSVKPGMIVHAIHNAGVVAFGWAAGALGTTMSEANLGLLVVGVLSLMILVALPAVLSLMRKTKPQGEGVASLEAKRTPAASLAVQAA